MMRKILISLCILAPLFTGACVRYDDVAKQGEDKAISFTAGSALLRDDVTKSASLGWVEDGGFFVYGSKTVDNVRHTVFNGTEVFVAPSIYYVNTQYWDNNASRYDFLAISGPSSASGITCNPESSGQISATLVCKPCEDPGELMVACHQRVPDGQTHVLDMTEVPLQFDHLLSAVKVVVYNDSPHDDITLLSIGFRNLVTEGKVVVTQGTDAPTVSWPNPDSARKKNTSSLLYEWAPENGVLLKSGGDADSDDDTVAHAPVTDVWNLMIPQDLNLLSLAPLLMVRYRHGSDEPVDSPISVKGIKTISGGDIFEWEAGVKYVYEVHIRYGGGIRVHVVTTEWDEVMAGTPGLIVS